MRAVQIPRYDIRLEAQKKKRGEKGRSRQVRKPHWTNVREKKSWDANRTICRRVHRLAGNEKGLDLVGGQSGERLAVDGTKGGGGERDRCLINSAGFSATRGKWRERVCKKKGKHLEERWLKSLNFQESGGGEEGLN